MMRCTVGASLFVVILSGCAGSPDAVPVEREWAFDHSSSNLRGKLLDNVANADRQGSGFHPLYHSMYPDSPIFRPELTGLNFEHVFNGVRADFDRSMFTPRKDTCILIGHDSTSATLYWPADESAWDMECRMTYTLAGDNALDIGFEATPRSDQYPLGYVAFMWASYMNRTRNRRIHFVGRDGDGPEEWITFGDDAGDGFETGTVAYAGADPLPYENESRTLNIIEHPTKRFTKPFYYGLLDGDNDLTTLNDTLAYIMMFDQSESIRFAEWNFIKDDDGNADPHSPAWDWQFVVRNPKPGTTYRYRARMAIVRFEGRGQADDIYEAWRASL